MIKATALLVLNLMVIFSLQAQKLKVTEKNENLGGGKHNALSVPIYETDEKTIIKEWKSLLKKYNAKNSEVGDEQFGDNAVIKDISNNTIDIYWKLEKGAENTYKIVAAYDLGGAFLSSSTHSKEYKVIESIMYNFSMELVRKSMATQLKDAQREAEKRDKKYQGLIKDNNELHSDIDGYKVKIKTAEDNIAMLC
jgi:hypothetical protein